MTSFGSFYITVSWIVIDEFFLKYSNFFVLTHPAKKNFYCSRHERSQQVRFGKLLLNQNRQTNS